MATRLMEDMYVKGRYLDANISVSSLSELINKWDFDGQSVHMPNAFESANGIPYPLDFWYIPNGEDVKWEVKSVPSFESEKDFEKFKDFIDDFKKEAGYFPLANGAEVLVNGVKYDVKLIENKIEWVDAQANFDETITDIVEIAVTEAIDKVTSGASEAFDTLKEIEDWIKANSGNTGGTPGIDGKDGITPKFKIENDFWFVSYNEGETWEQLGKATGEEGQQGEQGIQGEKGESAYEIWLQAGNEGSEADFLASLKGEKGDQGEQGIQGEKGEKGDQGENGQDGADGKSAYEIWLQAGNEGSEADFLASLKGEKGAIDEEELDVIKNEIFTSATSYTDKKISELEIPTIDGLASEQWVEEQGFIKEQNISHLASKDDLQEVVNNIPSLDGYATESYVKNAIAEAQLSGETEIDLSGYATKDDIKDLASKEDIKIYTSGTGVSIIDNKINVLIESGDTENRNYIKVNEDNSLSVEEIGLDDTVTTEEIQVNGGAWASAIQDIYGDTIPVGTSFQDFLKAMSCKEYFVTDITITSSFTVSLSSDLKPTFEGANSGDNVEVGTKIILGKVNGVDTIARQSLSAQTFTYGYKLGENGTHNNNKVYSEALLPIASGNTGVKNLKLSFTKFASGVQGGAISDKSANDSIESTTMFAQEGQNVVRIYQTGDTYTTNTAVTAGTIYIATNLKNYYKSDKVTPNTYTISVPVITKTATAQTTYTVTGAHKYFIGDITEKDNGTYWNENRSAEVRSLAVQNWATENTIEVQYMFKNGTKQQTVVVPSSYQSVTGKDVNNGDVTFNEVKTFEFTNAQGYKSMYKAFVAPAPDGLGADSIITITIKK